MKAINATGRVLLLVLLLAEEGRADESLDKAVKAIQSLGGRMTRDDNAAGKPIVTVDLGFTKMTDAGLKELAALKRLKKLYLHRTEVTDAGLKVLRGFEQLEMLFLGRTKVTDEGLKQLGGLKQLTTLDLRSTLVTEGGAADLQKALPKLKINLGGGKTLGPKQ